LPANSRASPLLHGVFVICLSVMLGGCGTVYVNKADRSPVYLKETDFSSTRNTEMTYRRIYTMLYNCTSGYYRIKGDYNPESHHG